LWFGNFGDAMGFVCFDSRVDNYIKLPFFTLKLFNRFISQTLTIL